MVEAFRSNQKVFELKPKYQLGAIAAHGSVVVIGEVGHFHSFNFKKFMVEFNCLINFFFGQDRKVHLNEWDGKTLKETVVLEGNQNIVSALAFSPDGKLLASGDVSFDFELVLLLSWGLTMPFF